MDWQAASGEGFAKVVHRSGAQRESKPRRWTYHCIGQAFNRPSRVHHHLYGPPETIQTRDPTTRRVKYTLTIVSVRFFITRARRTRRCVNADRRRYMPFGLELSG